MADKTTRYILTAEDRSRIAFESMQASFMKLDALAGKVGIHLSAAFSILGIAEFVSHSIEAADQTGKLAQKLGISTEALSVYKYAADLSNVSQEELTKGLGKLSNTMLAAATGNLKSSGILRALGVDMDGVRSGTLTLDQAFVQITKRVAGMQDSWQKTSLLQAAFGKSAKDLIPLMNDNADGFKAVSEEAAKLGIIIGGDLAARASDFNDNMTRLKAGMSAVGLAAASELMPALNDVAQAFLSMSSQKDSTTGFWSSIAELIRLSAVAAGSFWLALKDMGDGIGALMAQTAALAHFDLDAVRAIGAERDAQYEKNKKQFEEFQAQLLAHSKLFGDGTPEQPTHKPRGTEPPDLSEIAIDKSPLAKFLDELERETQKLDDHLDPILQKVNEKWLKVFQLAPESGLTIEAASKRAEASIDAYKEALEKARDETVLGTEETKRAQDRLSDWQGSKAIIDGLRDSIAQLNSETSIAFAGGSKGETTKWTEMAHQDMEIARQSIALTGEARDNFIAAAKAQQDAWAKAYDANYAATRSFAAGYKGAMSEIHENATNTADQVHTLFTNAFKGMEDALVSFVKTGKLDFKSLADSIITDLIRIQIQRSIIAPLSLAIGGAAGAGAAGSILSGFFGAGATANAGAASYGPTSSGGVPGRASGGPIDAGMPYWVGEQGPELVVPRSSGTVIPNGKTGGDHYFIDARGADQAGMARLEAMIRQLGGNIAPMAVAAVAQAKQRGVAGLR